MLPIGLAALVEDSTRSTHYLLFSLAGTWGRTSSRRNSTTRENNNKTLRTYLVCPLLFILKPGCYPVLLPGSSSSSTIYNGTSLLLVVGRSSRRVHGTRRNSTTSIRKKVRV